MKFVLTSFLFFVGSLAAAAQVYKDLNSPCRPLRVACMQAGFVLNDHNNPGNRLIKDCIAHLVVGENVQNRMTKELAVAPAGADLKGCKANIQFRSKVKNTGYTVGLKSNHRTNLEPRGTKSAHPASQIIAEGKAKLAAKRAARLSK